MKNLSEEKFSPWVVEQGGNIEKIVDFLLTNKVSLEQCLSDNGAILFRGGDIDDSEKVQKVANIFLSQVLKNNNEHKPVAKDSGVQTPVNYAPEEFLLWHSENTFNHSFPSKAIFACALPATSGGQTPLVDNRMVYEQIDENIKQEFAAKQIMYVRKYESHDFIGLGWKTIFSTEDKREVEKKCEQQQLEYEWLDGEILITKAVRPAIVKHPINGAMSWINQILHWHFHCLSPQTKSDIQALFVHEHLFPRHCYFGDGNKIPAEYLDHIQEVYRSNHMEFDWQKGDLLLVDNILKAHSRNPYLGERKMLVCFGDPISFGELQSC